MLIIAVIGLLVNVLVAFILRKENHSGHDHGTEDINVHSAYLHVIGDTISSIGVILAAILISFTGWNWLDPIVSILIGMIIFAGAYRVTRNALHILLEGVPANLSIAKIQSSMEDINGVVGIHDLHVWNICSGHVALSAHVVTKVDSIEKRELLLISIKQLLLSNYHIDHATLQLEQEKCLQVDCI